MRHAGKLPLYPKATRPGTNLTRVYYDNVTTGKFYDVMYLTNRVIVAEGIER